MHTELDKHAVEAASLLKAVAHDGRLKILCFLMTGEKSVKEVYTELSVRQASASQNLARLRLEGLVTGRREGKEVYYRISDGKVHRLFGLLFDIFCSDENQQ